jgi:hypothetical protein
VSTCLEWTCGDSISHIFSYFIVWKALQVRFSYPHFSDEKTKAEITRVIEAGRTAEI